MSDDLDEVALNVLLAEGLDAPTAYVASQRTEPSPASQQSPLSFFVWLFVLAVLVMFLAAWLSS